MPDAWTPPQWNGREKYHREWKTNTSDPERLMKYLFTMLGKLDWKNITGPYRFSQVVTLPYVPNEASGLFQYVIEAHAKHRGITMPELFRITIPQHSELMLVCFDTKHQNVFEPISKAVLSILKRGGYIGKMPNQKPDTEETILPPLIQDRLEEVKKLAPSLSNKQLAERLAVSESTIKRDLKKLGFRRRKPMTLK
jgi:hypothetical protein